SISTTFASLLLFINIRKQLGRIGIRQYLICFFKSLFASIIMGIVVYLIFFKITTLLPAVWIIELLMLLLSVAVGVIVYVIICSALGIQEIRILINTLVRKIRR
ncbi:MAG: murein biosynthesis integral membrane protein MurJ, partial [Tissierellia bacterium]|nr:murein biosynthesis integral membrane protein MurJ [Tissierellia bacterium]